MAKVRVGVVRGGPSAEYAVSLKTGASVLRNLDLEYYIPVDILLTTRSEWYMNGVRTNLADISHHVDVIWNALHGAFGEDGKVQKLFEEFSIPYTGSGVLASALGMNKQLAKERFSEAGMRIARGEVIDSASDAEEIAFSIFRNYHLPLIVKPVSGGSSVATRIVRSYDELLSAIDGTLQYGDVLIEEYIPGKEATCCVIDAGKEGDYFVLYPIEIVPPESKDFFDYDAKYSGESEEICPGRFDLMTHVKLRELASLAHKSIGARHYSRSDFIIGDDGDIYILEINTLPGLTEASLLPKALQTGGVQLPEFVDHVLKLALRR